MTANATIAPASSVAHQSSDNRFTPQWWRGRSRRPSDWLALSLGPRSRTAFVEQRDHARGKLINIGVGGIEHEVRVLRWLVGRVDPGQPGELAAAGTRVEALGVPLFALGQ